VYSCFAAENQHFIHKDEAVHMHIEHNVSTQESGRTAMFENSMLL